MRFPTLRVVIATAFTVIIAFFLWFPSLTNDASTRQAEELPKQPNDWFFRQRAFPKNAIDVQAWRKALQTAQNLRQSRKNLQASWQDEGPYNIGGRITTVAVHPGSPETVFIGAANGGVWRSSDRGLNWQPVFDNVAGTQSIGALAIAPSDNNIIFAGTGEANISADSYPGTGIYKSLDGGDSWTFSGLPESHHIGRIAIHPMNSQEIFVAVSGVLFGKNDQRGIYRSQDGGSSWSRVLFVSDSTSAIDVAINPVSPTTIFAAMWERIRRPESRIAGGLTTGLYRSDDGGNTWNPVGGGLPAPSTTNGRIGIAIAPSNPEIMYVSYADHPGYFKGLYKSTNGGLNWTQTNDGTLANLYSSFGWYFGNLAVSPTNPNTVYALGVPLYKTTNGGSSWFSSDGNMHVDHHAIWINPNNDQELYVGNDGGFYYSQNGGSSYSHRNSLPITQFYAGTVDANNSLRQYGGTQDNGTVRTNTGGNSNWSNILGGDGFYVVIDDNNGSIIYAESQWGNLNKSTNGGSTFNYIAPGSIRSNWMTPVALDPSNSNRLYYGGEAVYRSNNAGSSWNVISPDLSNGPYSQNSFGTITTLSPSPLNSQVIAAGTDDSNVWVTNDDGATWNKVSDALPQRWVTRVTTSPFDQNEILVSFSGFRIGQYEGHVYRSIDLGSTWVDISSNLPAAPVQDVIFDPLAAGTLYAGTDLGVFITTNNGASWQFLGDNLPLAGVMDLYLHESDRRLFAFTHGRGLYSLDLNDLTAINQPAEIIVDNLQLVSIYPNPFNPATRIDFRVKQGLEVEIIVFDVLGRPVRGLAKSTYASGSHSITWDGRNDNGRQVASGKYVVMLRSGQYSQSRVVTLAR